MFLLFAGMGLLAASGIVSCLIVLGLRKKARLENERIQFEVASLKGKKVPSILTVQAQARLLSNSDKLMMALLDKEFMEEPPPLPTMGNGDCQVIFVDFNRKVKTGTSDSLRKQKRQSYKKLKVKRNSMRRRAKKKMTRSFTLSGITPCCHYCSKVLDITKKHDHPDSMTVDHVVPLAKGGTNDMSNLVPCCLPCNMKKGQEIWVPNYEMVKSPVLTKKT